MVHKAVLHPSILLLFTLIQLPITAQQITVEAYGQLFHAVQMEEIFKDQKKFVDCPPKVSPDSIHKAYSILHTQPNFVLKNFVGAYFDTIPNDIQVCFCTLMIYGMTLPENLTIKKGIQL